jgi:hypothetical protein
LCCICRFFSLFPRKYLQIKGWPGGFEFKECCFFLCVSQRKRKIQDFKTKKRKKNTATNFSDGCLPAADHGHAQNKQLLLWSKSSKLL